MPPDTPAPLLGHSRDAEITDEMVERTALALFADTYVPHAERRRIVDDHWSKSGAALRSTYRVKARRVLEAAFGGPYA